jgi:gluconolactonase
MTADITWPQKMSVQSNLLLFLAPLLFLAMPTLGMADSPALYQSEWLTKENSFASGIEGPSVDREGSLYAMNLERNGTVGRIKPDGSTEVFLELPRGSQGNGSRIDQQNRMFIADYKKHNVLVVDLKADKSERKATVYFHDDKFNQPNDLALSKSGTLYASDPNWKDKTGRVWRIDMTEKDLANGSNYMSGYIINSPRAMGTTNGIELSPDERTLYVSESIKREIWSYDVSRATGDLTNAKLFFRFADASIDGLRADIDGNIFVARIEKGAVVILNPQGKIVREISLKGSEPSNLAFGGTDGKTVFVTQNKGRRIESFRVERPGREWCMLHAESSTCLR